MDTVDTKTIPDGYKLTDIGIIPIEWEVSKLGKIADVTKLAGFEYSKYFNSYKDGGEIVVIRGTNITNNRLDLSDIKTIPKKTSNKLLRSKLNKDDLVFAYVGTIGPVYLIDKDNKYHLGPNTSKITVHSDLTAKYLYSYFLGPKIKNEITEQTSVGAQPSLSMTKIRNFKIIYPKSKLEQTQIAQVLSDLDSLIQKTEKLIEKKKATKQAVASLLLSGKQRLSGFSRKWSNKKLGELLDYIQPTKYLVKSTDYSDDFTVPVLTAGKTFILGYTNESFGLFNNLPTIIFDDFTTASKYVDFNFKAKSSAMKMLVPRNKEVCLRFVFEKMQKINFVLGDHKRYWISEYQNNEIEIPEHDEQVAIAKKLTDMDNEINKIEKKLVKYNQIKQGTMQVLLTGKIRLNPNSYAKPIT